MIRIALAALLVLGTAFTFSLNAEDISKYKGGRALPAGEHSIVFPNHPKQSISFVSDSDEVIIGTVEFPGGEKPLGMATINADKGMGTGEMSIMVSWMRTGNATRDEHMNSGEWLDSANHAEIKVSDVKLERLDDTVYKVHSTWTIKGVSKEIVSHANVRFIPKFPYFGENIVRLKTTVDLPLKEFGVNHPAVGSPAVAATWQATIGLLGKVQ